AALLAALKAENEAPLGPEAAQALLAAAASSAGVKKGVLMKSLRAALLGSLQGPDLVATWRLLHPSGEDLARLERSL
ncbi:MAG: glutamate--tRNA ligase, partial [Prochlorococcaceae cyanobacterium]